MTADDGNGRHPWELAIEVYVEAASMSVPTVSSIWDGKRCFGPLGE